MNPPIIVASLIGNYNIVVQEVNKGVSVDTRGVDNSTALINAAAHGSGDTVEFLVSKGANLDLTDKYNQTAIDKAILNKEEDIAEFLELSGADKRGKTLDDLQKEGAAINHLKRIESIKRNLKMAAHIGLLISWHFYFKPLLTYKLYKTVIIELNRAILEEVIAKNNIEVVAV